MVMQNKLRQKIKALPMTPGCYMFKGENGAVLYVGKSKCLRRRVYQYFQKNKRKPAKIKKLAWMIADLTYYNAGTEIEALLLEYRLIKQYQPPFNTQLKNEAHPPFLQIDAGQPYPGLGILFGAPGGGWGDNPPGPRQYRFGPFAGLEEATQALRLLNAVWRVPLCGASGFPALPETAAVRKPCFNHSLNKCDAPCAGGLSTADYAARIKAILSFLRGHNTILNTLKRAMYQAADALDFEQAAHLRDQYHDLTALSDKLQKRIADFTGKRLCVLIGGFHEAAFMLYYIRDGQPFLQARFASAADWRVEKLSAFIAGIFAQDRDFSLHPRLTRAVADVQARKRYVDITRVKQPAVVCRMLNKAFSTFVGKRGR